MSKISPGKEEMKSLSKKHNTVAVTAHELRLKNSVKVSSVYMPKLPNHTWNPILRDSNQLICRKPIVIRILPILTSFKEKKTF